MSGRLLQGGGLVADDRGDADVGTKRTSERYNIVERDAKEQMRREIELAAMYETRELQQQKSRAYTTPSSCEPAQSVSDDVIAARRRLRDVGPPNSLSLRVDNSVGETSVAADNSCQSPSHSSDPPRRRRHYSSPGEELVYREMMEHQRREMELRRHWKQVYGVYIAPPPADDFRAAATPEPEMGANKTGNENGHRRSPRDQYIGAHNGGNVKAYSTPLAARINSGSRNGRRNGDENEAVTSSTPAANQRASYRHVTRTTSEIQRGRLAGLETSKNSRPQQCETPVTHRHDQSVELEDLRRRSRDEAENRIESEVVEAMRRERELREMRESLRSVSVQSDTATEE